MTDCRPGCTDHTDAFHDASRVLQHTYAVSGEIFQSTNHNTARTNVQDDIIGLAGSRYTLSTPAGLLQNVPYTPTPLNTRLLEIFLKLFARFKTSIDGNPDLEGPYHKLYMPFCIHDPLLVQISIFTVACFLTETRQLDKQQSILIKGHTIRMLNERLRSTEDSISDAAIAGVCQLILNEWYWGDMDELRAHLKGMRHMIQQRGGYHNLGLEGLLSKMVIVTDFGIAMTFELPPYLQEGEEFQFEDRTPVEHKVSSQSPLAASDSSFASCAQAIGLHPTTASILDDIRFLIALAISTPFAPDAQQTQKLKWTANWIHNRIEALPNSSPASELETITSTNKGEQDQSSATLTSTSGAAQQPGSTYPDDYLYQSIRQAALVYTRAIAAGKPFSRTCAPDDFYRLWVTIWRVPLSVWKSLVGVFLWIEAALLAVARDMPHGRFVKSMFNIAALTLAIEDWEVGVAALRGALALQTRLGGKEAEATT